MQPQHQRVIDRIKTTFEPDPHFLAVIVGGSVAKERAKEDSDVDIMLLATEEEFARRAEASNYIYFTTDLVDYPGGYVDGKVVDLAFLNEVAERGSEPARAAFYMAYPIYSHYTGLDDLLARITTYPEAQREAKMKSFYSQVLLLTWYIGEAEKRSDPYLLTRMTAEMVLYSGRLMLAYNRILYPYHKWFMTDLKRAPDKPENFLPLIDDLLAAPTKAKAQALSDCVTGFADWGVTFPEAVVNFLKDSEWNWRNGYPPLGDS